MGSTARDHAGCRARFHRNKLVYCKYLACAALVCATALVKLKAALTWIFCFAHGRKDMLPAVLKKISVSLPNTTMYLNATDYRTYPQLFIDI